MSILNQLSGGMLHTQYDTNAALIKAIDALHKAQKELFDAQKQTELTLKSHEDKLSNLSSEQGSQRLNTYRITTEVSNLQVSVANMVDIKEVLVSFNEMKSDILDIRALYIKKVEQLETDINNIKFVVKEFIAEMEKHYPIKEDHV